MPCYEQTTLTVELANADRDLLQETLDELGINARYANNILTLWKEDEAKLGEIKRRYAEKLLRKVSKEKKWSLAKTDDRHFTLNR